MNASRLFAAIMNGQSRAIGNIGYTRQDEDKPSQAKKTKKTKKQKTKAKTACQQTKTANSTDPTKTSMNPGAREG
jgi:cell division septation protein DedD